MNQNTKINRLNQIQYDRPKNMDIDLLNEEIDYQDRNQSKCERKIFNALQFVISYCFPFPGSFGFPFDEMKENKVRARCPTSFFTSFRKTTHGR